MVEQNIESYVPRNLCLRIPELQIAMSTVIDDDGINDKTYEVKDFTVYSCNDFKR